ncbi:MAG: hypothetical protein JNL01_10085 [Bdellovibrionales bacterium]|nr:hypothetical protein [Bdellovibrionales bacterium]
MKAYFLPMIISAAFQSPGQASQTIYQLDCGSLSVTVHEEKMMTEVSLKGSVVSKDFDKADAIESTQDGLKVTWSRSDGSQDVLELTKTTSTSVATLYEGSFKSSSGVEDKDGKAVDLKLTCTL